MIFGETAIRIVGYGGQAVFAMRFIWQWVQSERTGRSIIPVGFWWCSLIGGVCLSVYSVEIKAWPIVLGQISGLLIYTRNLWMIYRPKADSPSERK